MARASSYAFMAPGVLGALAFILSAFGGIYCKFLSHLSTSNFESEEPIALNSGIWYYQGYAVTNTTVQGTIILETCNKYPEGTYVDPRWKAARAFTVMALIIGGVVTFWALLAQCIYPNKAMYRLGGMIMMVCCLFQGLTLLFLDSEACHNNSLTQVLENELSVATLSFSDTCVMAMGAKCAIAGTVMWFFAALSAFKVEPPKRAPVMVQTQDVTYTKTTNPEGTTVVTETVIKGEPVEVGSAAAAQDTSAADAETPRDAN